MILQLKLIDFIKKYMPDLTIIAWLSVSYSLNFSNCIILKPLHQNSLINIKIN
ncbi:hypothetical protein SAMN05216167_10535 [Spirosoma endophyticum]|uniref:Uncharacterized protein n=1 Tax=Spirosoma endophyticum TaxID=662367 RepID=A0A1I1SB96_9BACT|nr:hypothetical protein SAMN05216167_10535 [Spirosoma endophyticum]